MSFKQNELKKLELTVLVHFNSLKQSLRKGLKKVKKGSNFSEVESAAAAFAVSTSEDANKDFKILTSILNSAFTAEAFPVL